MSRAVNLLICLAILVGGMAIEAPADGKPESKSADKNKPCCGNTEVKANKAGEPEISTCLQYLLYEDATEALWSANIYLDSTCTDTPIEDYIWTGPGESGPQSCYGEPACKKEPEGNGNCPSIMAPLPKNKGYVDVLKAKVPYPGLSTNKTWNAKDGLVDLGELKTTYVKVKNVEGQYFAVRLAAGMAEMEKIRFPAGAYPKKPKIANLKILIGFEAEMDQQATPSTWNRYPDCPTAFILSVDHNDYYVTTTTANPVPVTARVVNLSEAKPIPKKTSNRSEGNFSDSVAK